MRLSGTDSICGGCNVSKLANRTCRDTEDIVLDPTFRTWPSTNVDLPPDNDVDSLMSMSSNLSSFAYESRGCNVWFPKLEERCENEINAPTKSKTTKPAIPQGSKAPDHRDADEGVDSGERAAGSGLAAEVMPEILSKLCVDCGSRTAT